MKLICGLGNPGKEYENTRHNVGFMILDNYLKDEKWSNKFNGLYIEKKFGSEKAIFLKPQSYMNLSGDVVKPFLDYFGIELKDVLIIRDDLDLTLGRTRIKFDSSSGGDNGIKSIIDRIGSQKFYQYKIGISNDKKMNTKDYVLKNFSKDERDILNIIIEDSPNIINDFLANRIIFNKDYTYGEVK